MARFATRFATAAACVAALSLVATPAMARGWHGGYRHHYHNGISGGGLLAGALILGGIAAVASAANNSDHDSDRDYRYETPPPRADNPEYRGSSYSGDSGGRYSGSSYAGGGIDGAVNSCVGEVERGQDRVSAVDNARRTTDGWQISGQMGRGGNFTCAIDNDGHITNVDVGGQSYDNRSGDNGAGYDGTGPDNRPVWNGADAGQSAGDQWNDSDDTDGGDYSE